MKAKVSLKLSKLSGSEKIEKGRHMVTSMTGNSNFTTPFPTLANVTTAINAYETAYNAAQGGGTVLTAYMHDKEVLLDNILTQLGHYVESSANGIESAILSAGMDIKGKGGNRSVGFTAAPGKVSGDVILHAKAIGSRGAFIFEKTGDVLADGTKAIDSSGWQEIGVSLKANFTVSNLIVGLRYWFRYAAVTKDGQSSWSDPISIIVSL
ncbi:MAG: hypothetical protein A3F72_16645 [Bacteroidetes bacterium RIFCSPLOWO2_12_FULL_35_15]|nr:MAG: hypothetical protein A3F72_16645 [Bacteroidetes bacterium RIFCSPLOWO2_12_FULL_35_15]